jgi:hypothetical protein
MKYALKVSRETNSSIIHVHPIEEVPDNCKPYRVRRGNYYVEGLQIFKTRATANTARAMEIIAAEYAQKTPNELRRILRDDMERLANFGITNETMCKLINESSGTLNTYLASTKRISPRIVAKFHIIAGHIARLANFGNTILPADGGCGATHMGTGGNHEIWKLHKEKTARAKKPETV